MANDFNSEFEEIFHGAGGGLDAVLDQRQSRVREDARRQMLAARAREVLASTAREGDFVANGIWGVDLARRLADPVLAPGHFLVDLRSREAYERGHIAGALHMPLAECLAPETLGQLPAAGKIVLVCDTGNAGPQAVAALRLLGYDAVVLRTGMNGWAPTPMTETVLEDIAAAYPVEHTPPEPFAPAARGEFAAPDEETYTAALGKLRRILAATEREGDFAGNLVHPRVLSRLVSDPGSRERPFILDLRREEDFEGVGHLPGAMQVDFDAALEPENLERLPRDRRIVAICYTGNTAAQLVTMLRLLDYDAVALRYGMVGWKMTPTTYLYKKDLERAGNPVERAGA